MRQIAHSAASDAWWAKHEARPESPDALMRVSYADKPRARSEYRGPNRCRDSPDPQKRLSDLERTQGAVTSEQQVTEQSL